MNGRNMDKDGASPSRSSESPVPSTSNAAGTPVPSTSNAAGAPIPSTSHAASTSPQPGTSSETRRLLESVMPRRDPNNDNHSSEEELEDINSQVNDPSCGETRPGLMSLNLRESSASDNSVSGLPEKRRWPRAGTARSLHSCKMDRESANTERSRSDHCSESSDEEIQDLLANIESNVDNRPPSTNNDRPSVSGSPPTKPQNEEEKNEGSTSQQAHASGQAQVQVAQHLLQRPYLDFEKMQQSSYSSGNFDYVEEEEQESP